MFENIINFFKKFSKKEEESAKSKDTAKERLHLVLMQDRANVSADFLEMMKQEIIEVIKKYIEIDEKEIDVKLTNKTNEDGSIGAPALYANIPIAKIKNENKLKTHNNLNDKQTHINNKNDSKIKGEISNKVSIQTDNYIKDNTTSQENNNIINKKDDVKKEGKKANIKNNEVQDKQDNKKNTKLQSNNNKKVKSSNEQNKKNVSNGSLK